MSGILAKIELLFFALSSPGHFYPCFFSILERGGHSALSNLSDLPRKKGPRAWDGLPDHLYYAAGFGGNFIVVDDQKDLVIVTRWLEPSKIGEMVRLIYTGLE